ncbi:type II toxin-antitoxin system YafQ family toxin [Rhodopseudomonas palustris]|uniref:Addiction module toxin, RelE/StbE n=1 Tax=Rhodopseudomonas palustris (strain BisB18) TaxID=316056 RepID=Q219J8_RHOPB
MKTLDHTGSFNRDLKRVTKRGYDLTKLAIILRLLQTDTPLPASNRPHALKGRWSGFLECHIAPDWLLIYQTEPTRVILARTGTHSDLFGK